MTCILYYIIQYLDDFNFVNFLLLSLFLCFFLLFSFLSHFFSLHPYWWNFPFQQGRAYLKLSQNKPFYGCCCCWFNDNFIIFITHIQYSTAYFFHFRSAQWIMRKKIAWIRSINVTHTRAYIIFYVYIRFLKSSRSDFLVSLLQLCVSDFLLRYNKTLSQQRNNSSSRSTLQ